MGSFYSKNKNDVFNKYAWIKPKDKKNGKTVLNVLSKIVNESNRELNRLWTDKRREFCKRLTQKCLENNNIFLCSTHNKGKSIVDKRFVKTLKA